MLLPSSPKFLQTDTQSEIKLPNTWPYCHLRKSQTRSIVNCSLRYVSKTNYFLFQSVSDLIREKTVLVLETAQLHTLHIFILRTLHDPAQIYLYPPLLRTPPPAPPHPAFKENKLKKEHWHSRQTIPCVQTQGRTRTADAGEGGGGIEIVSPDYNACRTMPNQPNDTGPYQTDRRP